MEPNTITIIILLLIGMIIAYYIGSKVGHAKREKYWISELPNHRKDAILRSRAVLGGQFSEQLAPFLPNFPYNPNECRFIGKPIDLIVFKGMDEKEIEEVKFIEIKSGNSQLSSSEKKLKEAIENKRVSWEEYRIPRELTDNKE
jgi:predicted Holliday junction resolvase-like endonuclease